MSVILSQTDTTVGFLSQNASELFEIKSRNPDKPFIKIYPTLKEYVSHFNRIPNNQKKLVRRAQKTTFIVKNKAFRITKSSLNSQILRELSWYYSTSANQSGKHFERIFCQNKADIIIEDVNGFSEKSSSKLLKINNTTQKRLR